MAATFSEIKAGLDEIAGLLRDQRATIASAYAKASGVVDALNAMATNYGHLMSDIDAFAAANGSNAAAVNAKSEKDQLLAEYTALLAKAQGVVTAAA